MHVLRFATALLLRVRQRICQAKKHQHETVKNLSGLCSRFQAHDRRKWLVLPPLLPSVLWRLGRATATVVADSLSSAISAWCPESRITTFELCIGLHPSLSITATLIASKT